MHPVEQMVLNVWHALVAYGNHVFFKGSLACHLLGRKGKYALKFNAKLTFGKGLTFLYDATTASDDSQALAVLKEEIPAPPGVGGPFAATQAACVEEDEGGVDSGGRTVCGDPGQDRFTAGGSATPSGSPLAEEESDRLKPAAVEDGEEHEGVEDSASMSDSRKHAKAVPDNTGSKGRTKAGGRRGGGDLRKEANIKPRESVHWVLRTTRSTTSKTQCRELQPPEVRTSESSKTNGSIDPAVSVPSSDRVGHTGRESDGTNGTSKHVKGFPESGAAASSDPLLDGCEESTSSGYPGGCSTGGGVGLDAGAAGFRAHSLLPGFLSFMPSNTDPDSGFPSDDSRISSIDVVAPGAARCDGQISQNGGGSGAGAPLEAQKPSRGRGRPRSGKNKRAKISGESASKCIASSSVPPSTPLPWTPVLRDDTASSSAGGIGDGKKVASETPEYSAEFYTGTPNKEEWACKLCTFVNSSLLAVCDMCRTRRPAGPRITRSKMSGLSPLTPVAAVAGPHVPSDAVEVAGDSCRDHDNPNVRERANEDKNDAGGASGTSCEPGENVEARTDHMVTLLSEWAARRDDDCPIGKSPQKERLALARQAAEQLCDMDQPMGHEKRVLPKAGEDPAISKPRRSSLRSASLAQRTGLRASKVKL